MADVTAEAIQKIVDLAEVAAFPGKPGELLSSDQLHKHDLRPDVVAAVAVETLSGLVDLIEQKAYPVSVEIANLMLKVDGPGVVQLFAKQPDEYGRRPALAYAKLPPFAEFQFGQFFPHEEFVMKVMTLFASCQDDRDYVLQMARSVTAGSTITTEDDGITQKVVIQTGAALKSAVEMKSRVKLSPYRTFRECTQPMTEFCFRLKMQGGTPTLALIESDGGIWRIDAMKNIKTWLTNALKAQGVGEVPVIA